MDKGQRLPLETCILVLKEAALSGIMAPSEPDGKGAARAGSDDFKPMACHGSIRFWPRPFGRGFCFGLCHFAGFRQPKGGVPVETRVAIVGIIVENPDSVERLNAVLHEYGAYIIGRMGIPYRERKINIISIAMDAP